MKGPRRFVARWELVKAYGMTGWTLVSGRRFALVLITNAKPPAGATEERA